MKRPPPPPPPPDAFTIGAIVADLADFICKTYKSNKKLPNTRSLSVRQSMTLSPAPPF